MDSLSIQGIPPAVLIACAALAAWGGWPYVVQYWPQIQALLTSMLRAPSGQMRSVQFTTHGTATPRGVLDPIVIQGVGDQATEFATVPDAVVHLVALEAALSSAGVTPADRAKLVDPLWPRIMRQGTTKPPQAKAQ